VSVRPSVSESDVNHGSESNLADLQGACLPIAFQLHPLNSSGVQAKALRGSLTRHPSHRYSARCRLFRFHEWYTRAFRAFSSVLA
jgi:hypothetical protein